MSESKKLPDFLKECRTRAGLSQLAVARAVNYSSPQFVSNWERGVSLPPLPVFGKLIDLYKIKRHEIIDLLVQEHRSRLEAKLCSEKDLSRTSCRKPINEQSVE
jgi:transcriptional regulator with XRE-family HTH domain